MVIPEATARSRKRILYGDWRAVKGGVCLAAPGELYARQGFLGAPPQAPDGTRTSIASPTS